MTKTFSNPEYGYCPFCGAHGKTRERRPGGNDTCHNGHLYPSSKAMTDVEAGLCDDPEKLKKRISSLEAMLAGYLITHDSDSAEIQRLEAERKTWEDAAKKVADYNNRLEQQTSELRTAVKSCNDTIRMQEREKEELRREVEDLRHTIHCIRTTEESYDDEQTVLCEIYQRCRDALKGEG